uniref:Uncharacterized protein n=1 Tax=viral metagenome TaxID=1070528 RepID=A0A6H1ZXS1_9ZZZZ
MVEQKQAKGQRPIPGWQLRRLTKTGGTRSLSVGTILPPDWKAVKVFVVSIKDGVCVLKLEQIK